ncbi:hypothetical protein ABPG74_007950 [Tetrahymena malaccensis]
MNGFVNPKLSLGIYDESRYMIGTSQKLMFQLQHIYQQQLNNSIKIRQANQVYYHYIKTNFNQNIYGNIPKQQLAQIFIRAKEKTQEEENIIQSLSRRIVLKLEKYIKQKYETEENIIETEHKLDLYIKQVAGILQDVSTQTVEMEPFRITKDEELHDIYFIPLYLQKSEEQKNQTQN